MKNYINFFSIIGFIFLTFHSIGQSTDNGWYYKNGIVRAPNGTSATIQIANNIYLKGIGSPNIVRHPSAKDDLFVIFENGDYYNSRYFQPNYRYSNNSLALRFPHAIKYLYLTEKYDEDPPEGKVEIIPPGAIINNITSPMMPNIPLSANHNVTKDDDITLIVNTVGLKEGDALTWNEVKDINGNIQTLNLLEPSPVFDGSFINLPLGSYTTNNGSITFDQFSTLNKKFIYINLKGNNRIEEYLPVPNIKDNTVVFKIKDGNNNVKATLEEKILDGHDPNIIVAKALCKDEEGDLYVKYDLQVENTNTNPVNEVKVLFELPSFLKSDEINIIKSEVMQQFENPDRISVRDHKVVLVWKRAVLSKILGDEKSGFINVTFCAKVENKNRLTQDFSAFNSFTYFDGKIYNLETADGTCIDSTIVTQPYIPKYLSVGKGGEFIECARNIVECDECSVCDFSCYLEKNKMPIGIAVFLSGGLLILGARRMKKLKEQGERMRRINEEDNNLDS